MKLDPQEQKIEIFRKHWLVMFFEILLFGFIALIPLVSGFVVIHFSGVIIDPVLERAITVIIATWLLFVWIAFFIVYTDYYLDIWVLTDKRLIDAEQLGLFSREVSVARLEHIQDATTNVTGLLPTIFGYGDVHIQTAAHDKEFILRNVQHPKRVRDLIMREQERKSQEVQRVKIV